MTVKNGTTTLASYGYDGLNHRITETHGTTTTDLYYSAGWQLLEERVNGVVQARYVWSRAGGVDVMVLRDDSSLHNGVLDRRLYVQQDANWNVTALVDTSGNVVERFDYDPYGVVTVLNPDFSLRGTSSYGWLHFFQGKRYDGAVSLYDSRERVYSPTLMRPLQTDPLGLLPDVNYYRWEGNGPTDKIDPNGLQYIGVGYFFGLRRGRIDYEGVDRFPVSGWEFYNRYIRLKYGNRWDIYKLGCLGLAKCRLGIVENSPLPELKGGTPFNLFRNRSVGFPLWRSCLLLRSLECGYGCVFLSRMPAA